MKTGKIYIEKKEAFLFGLLLVSCMFLFKCDNKKNDSEELLALMIFMNAAPVNNEFSNPQKVTISGYAGHAMEPFITRDSQYLFFNSLNDAIDTSIYYATRTNDITFTGMGKITGSVNGVPNHLDAVPSMDRFNNLFFVSTRNYPADYKNLYAGSFAGGGVPAVTPVTGTYYLESPGWIVMDAEISDDGNDLYCVNAHFSGGSIPDQSDIGVARKSGGDFIKNANSAEIMKNVNTEALLEYAPCISGDGLELFFTRMNPSPISTQIMVAKRGSASEPFGAPARIGVLSGIVEAPSLTADGRTLYYHFNENGVYAIYKISR